MMIGKKTILFLAIAFPLYFFAQTDTSEVINTNVQLSGTLTLEAGLFRSSRTPNRIPGEYFRFNGNPRLRIGDWDIPFNFQIGNYANRLTQPFNKFGASPSYKWIKFHVGHRQLEFSPFTYRNHLLLGGGIDLDPGKFRFTVLAGELKRQSDGGFLEKTNRNVLPSLRRLGILGKIGYGTSDRYFDLIFIKGWDEENTITTNSDSLGIYPEENVVIGLHSEFRISKKLKFNVSSAASLYSLDTRSPTYDVDPFFGSDLALQVFEPKLSSQYLGAGSVGLEYKYKLWQSELSYTLIQPGYQSMGMYFNQSDLSKVELSTRGQMLNNKLKMSLNWRRENNNLLETRTSQNIRNYLSGQWTWTQKKSWMATLGTSYFTTEQNSTIEDSIPTFLFSQETIQGSLNFIKRRSDRTPRYTIRLAGTNRKDRLNNNTAYENISVRGSYVVILDQDANWRLHPEFGLTHFVVLQSIAVTRWNPGLKLSYRSKNNGWDGQIKGEPVFEIKENLSDNFVWRTMANVGCRFKKKHRFSMRFNQSSSFGNFNYNEWRAVLGYSVRL